MADKKGLMVLGIGSALALPFIINLFRKGKPALPEAPPNGVVVGLLNSPSDTTMWSLVLCDWDITTVIPEISGKERLDIAEAATFEVPSGAAFPLRSISLQLTKWNADGTALIQVYYVQSMHPYLWDFDTGNWSTTPDPTYREAFIPDYGSYYFNVATEQFEKA